MITNIVDCRINEYATQKLQVVVEPSFHDNRVQGADQFQIDETLPSHAILDKTTLVDAIAWANQMPGQMTLYLYDEGSDRGDAVLDDASKAPIIRLALLALQTLQQRLKAVPDYTTDRLVSKAIRELENRLHQATAQG